MMYVCFLNVCYYGYFKFKIIISSTDMFRHFYSLIILERQIETIETNKKVTYFI